MPFVGDRTWVLRPHAGPLRRWGQAYGGGVFMEVHPWGVPKGSMKEVSLRNLSPLTKVRESRELSDCR